MSRQIEALERAIGLVLFRKSLDGYRLTDEGRGLVPRAEAVERAVQALGATTSSGVEGRVRLANTESIAMHLLTRPLRELQDRFPGLRLELPASSSAVDLLSTEADVALRLVRQQAGILSVRKLGCLAFAAYRDADGAGERGFISWMSGMADLLSVRWIKKSGEPVVMKASSLSV